MSYLSMTILEISDRVTYCELVLYHKETLYLYLPSWKAVGKIKDTDNRYIRGRSVYD